MRCGTRWARSSPRRSLSVGVGAEWKKDTLPTAAAAYFGYETDIRALAADGWWVETRLVQRAASGNDMSLLRAVCSAARRRITSSPTLPRCWLLPMQCVGGCSQRVCGDNKAHGCLRGSPTGHSVEEGGQSQPTVRSLFPTSLLRGGPSLSLLVQQVLTELLQPLGALLPRVRSGEDAIERVLTEARVLTVASQRSRCYAAGGLMRAAFLPCVEGFADLAEGRHRT
jgi:hypothetical protein